MTRPFRMPGAILLVLVTMLSLAGCNFQASRVTVATVPLSNPGGGDTSGIIAGHVRSPKAGERIVVYSRGSDRQWWVQPLAVEPFTEIQPDGEWRVRIHLGMEYAAVLVKGEYSPKVITLELPAVEGPVEAVVRRPAVPATIHPMTYAQDKTVHFSGYDWRVRAHPGGYGGTKHEYDPSLLWVAPDGAMHLRMKRAGEQWVCAEASTVRSLGYGTYSFIVEDTSHFESATMLSMFTWNDAKEQNHREIDIHVSRWGDAKNKGGEYVVQPYYVPANVSRFDFPAGPTLNTIDWRPGSVTFTTYRGKTATGKPLARWTTISGVPGSDGERSYLNLCEFAYGEQHVNKEAEAVIESFDFKP